MTILHITSEAGWKVAQAIGEYDHPTLHTEGFIHASLPEQVAATAERYYKGQMGLVLLVIDPALVRAEIKYEVAGNGQTYPHIYGPLNTDAVVAVHSFPPEPDGTFRLPEL